MNTIICLKVIFILVIIGPVTEYSVIFVSMHHWHSWDEKKESLSTLWQICGHNKSGKLHRHFYHTQSSGLNTIQHCLSLIFGKKAKYMSFYDVPVEQHSHYIPVNFS